ncbi:MAG TPA: hypothetical protein VFI78_04390 [Salinimicrobium sp.]|nr:hypothetical protein [Salinimicrobium sp.]
MKKIVTLIALIGIAFFTLTSCSSDGEMGPPGPQGPPGEDGLDGLGYTFEETATFEYSPEDNLWYFPLITIPENVTTINPDADAVLVYRLEIVEANDGGNLDAWSLIPQNFFLEGGTIQYVYNHTAGDVDLIIGGNFDLSNLDPYFTDNQTFRIVVVPSDFLSSQNVDVSNYNAVMSALKIKEKDIPTLNISE